MSKHTPVFTRVRLYGAVGGSIGLSSDSCRITGNGFESLEQAERLIAEAPAMLKEMRRLVAYAAAMEKQLNLDSPHNVSLEAARAILSRIDAK